MPHSDLPSKYEALLALSARVEGPDPVAVQACLDLLAAAHRIRRSMDKNFFRTNLSEGRFSVLAMLLNAPDWSLTPSELADGCGVTRATMTGLLDGLEGQAMVERKAVKTDRRKIMIRLTREGRERLLEILPEFYKAAAGSAPLSEAQGRAVTALASRIPGR